MRSTKHNVGYILPKHFQKGDQFFSSFSWKNVEYTGRVTVPFKQNEKQKMRSKRVVKDEKLNFNKFIQQIDIEGFWILKANGGFRNPHHLKLLKKSTALEPTFAGNIRVQDTNGLSDVYKTQLQWTVRFQDYNV